MGIGLDLGNHDHDHGHEDDHDHLYPPLRLKQQPNKKVLKTSESPRAMSLNQQPTNTPLVRTESISLSTLIASFASPDILAA
jgi:hypothetical protein